MATATNKVKQGQQKVADQLREISLRVNGKAELRERAREKREAQSDEKLAKRRAGAIVRKTLEGAKKAAKRGFHCLRVLERRYDNDHVDPKRWRALAKIVALRLKRQGFKVELNTFRGPFTDVDDGAAGEALDIEW